ncbi:helix-turn-helix domain-containing protein [Actinoplanes sp. NPDC048796]|uniref:helix-turn-helix domain-containing protein n=1 Tax=Actinoplanes sp. NPDC048796 TaxID=3155640 RepID=UPI0033FF1DE1
MREQVHSVPVGVPVAACEVAVGRPDCRLRGHVIGYSGFRSGARAPIAHRLLAVSSATLIIDFGSASGLVTGPRSEHTTDGDTTWGHGVSVGLTPAGVAALLGVPMGELAGETVALSELMGPNATRLPSRLAAAPDWAARWELLDLILGGALGLEAPAQGSSAVPAPRAAGPDPAVVWAWRRLQEAGAPRVEAVAGEVGRGRRRLEREFRRDVGLSPGQVARIARFQRAAAQLGGGAAPAAVAAGNGYADQSHLTREMRVLAGVTPGELRVLFEEAGARLFKTGGRPGP